MANGTKTIRFEGKTYRVPVDATPEEVEQAISAGAKLKQKMAEPPEAEYPRYYGVEGTDPGTPGERNLRGGVEAAGTMLAAAPVAAFATPVGAAKSAITATGGQFVGERLGSLFGPEGRKWGGRIGAGAGFIGGPALLRRGTSLPTSRFSLLNKVLGGATEGAEAASVAGGQGAAVEAGSASPIITPAKAAEQMGRWHAGMGEVPDPRLYTPKNLRLFEKIKRLGGGAGY